MQQLHFTKKRLLLKSSKNEGTDDNNMKIHPNSECTSHEEYNGKLNDTKHEMTGRINDNTASKQKNKKNVTKTANGHIKMQELK